MLSPRCTEELSEFDDDDLDSVDADDDDIDESDLESGGGLFGGRQSSITNRDSGVGGADDMHRETMFEVRS